MGNKNQEQWVQSISGNWKIRNNNLTKVKTIKNDLISFLVFSYIFVGLQKELFIILSELVMKKDIVLALTPVNHFSRLPDGKSLQ